MPRWLADLCRAAWALVYWNVRKSVHQRQRNRERAPCQNPSDSGRANETGCEACVHWNNPARFRHVCPLLRRNAQGQLRCSVDSSEVRPFWGRAVLLAATLAVVGYGGVSAAAWGFFRWRGYELPLTVLVWPPAWQTFPQAQGMLFFKRAQIAAREGRINEALISYQIAFERDPNNYDAGFAYAQLLQAGHPVQADRIFLHLLRNHTTQRARTAEVWYRALLSRGDFNTIVRLSVDVLTAQPDAATVPAWTQALLFSLQQANQTNHLTEVVKANTALPGETRAVLETEAALATLAEPQARALLLARAGRELSSPIGVHYVCQRLMRLNGGADALAILARAGTRIGPRERLSLQLAGYRTAGWNSLFASELDRLLQGPVPASIVEVLAAHLLRYPDAAVAQQLFRTIEEKPLPSTPALFPVYSGLLVVAGTVGDLERVDLFGSRLREIAGTRFEALKFVRSYFAGQTDDQRLSTCLPVLQPLPLDVIYAWYEHADALAREKKGRR